MNPTNNSHGRGRLDCVTCKLLDVLMKGVLMSLLRMFYQASRWLASQGVVERKGSQTKLGLVIAFKNDCVTGAKFLHLCKPLLPYPKHYLSHRIAGTVD